MNKVIVYRSRLLPLSETFILAQLLTLKRWRPILIGKKMVPGSLSLDGVETEILVVPQNRWPGWTKSVRYWMNQPDAEALLLFQHQKADLVHVHFGTDAVEIWPTVKAAGLPMLVTLHGYDINIRRDWWEKGHGGLRGFVYPRRLLSMARSPGVQFVAVSEAVRRRAIEYGFPDDKVTVAYIGVDTQRFRPFGLPLTQRRKRVLFVGRMVEKKAPLLMVRAFAQVHEQVPDAELMMVGDGPLRSDAEQLAIELNLPVIFTGALSSDQVLEQLHQARVFCLPSVTAANGDAEGLPISILEALACGVPVVTSACGRITEAVVDGVTGFTVPEGDVDRLGLSLNDSLTNDEKITRMSKHSRERVLEIYEINGCTRHLERMYSNIIEKSNNV